MPGYHLPYLAAAASGLFADFDLDVQLLEPAPGPENVRRVAEGGADFCLTSVNHYLKARSLWGDLPARYTSVVVQRNPMAGIVDADSRFTTPADLSGARLGGPADSKLVADYQAALRWLGLAPAELVPIDYGEAPAALGRGEVDAVGDYIDLMPRTRRQAGIEVRGVPFGLPLYSSGLVAADRLPADVVERMGDAVAAALEQARDDPDGGMDALLRRYPDVDPGDALEGWELAVPNIFTGAPVGSMDAATWAATLEFAAGAQNLPFLPPETVYRPERALQSAP